MIREHLTWRVLSQYLRVMMAVTRTGLEGQEGVSLAGDPGAAPSPHEFLRRRPATLMGLGAQGQMDTEGETQWQRGKVQGRDDKSLNLDNNIRMGKDIPKKVLQASGG